MKSILCVIAFCFPLILFAQFPLELAPLNSFNDLILLRDINDSPKWHMKILGNGGLGFSESNVADGRLILNPGGGISLFGGGLGINANLGLNDLLVAYNDSGNQQVAIRKDGEFLLGNYHFLKTPSGKVGINSIPGLTEVFTVNTDISNSAISPLRVKTDGFVDITKLRIANSITVDGYVATDLGINVHPSPAVTFSIKAQPDDTWVIYADDTNSDLKFNVQTNGNAFLKGSLSQNSDVRLKTSILRLPTTIQSLNKVNGYSYFWKNNPANTNKQIGLLAQEVMLVYPELVSEAANGTLSVNYTGFIPILIEAFKDQSKVVEQQHETINQLELRLQALEDKLNRL